jgi:hypothetical protein
MAHRLQGWTAIRYAEKHGGTNYFHSIFDGWLEPETKGR